MYAKPWVVPAKLPTVKTLSSTTRLAKFVWRFPPTNAELLKRDNPTSEQQIVVALKSPKTFNVLLFAVMKPNPVTEPVMVPMLPFWSVSVGLRGPLSAKGPLTVRLLLLTFIVPVFIAGVEPALIARPPRPVTLTVPLFVNPPLFGVKVKGFAALALMVPLLTRVRFLTVPEP